MRKKFFSARWKRCIALTLVASMVTQYGSDLSYAKAQKANQYNYLPEATMPKEIQAADSFYVGTTSADLAEDAEAPYLLKIGRGGDAKEEASVVLKISDATANYGKDYKIRTHESGFFTKTAEDNPKDNQSLLDIIEAQDVVKEQLVDEENEEAAQEEAENLLEKQAENLLKEQEDDLEDKVPEWAKEIQSDLEATVIEGDHVNNPLSKAKSEMTGLDADRKNVISTNQTMTDVLSNAGDYLTEAVPGATLTVAFGAGEKEKYIEIIPRNNKESDGDRIFYVTLSEPSEGMTNSAVSESIFTLKDDEPIEKAKVSFSKATYQADSNTVQVVLERTGAMTQTVSVHMKSQPGSAVAGRDFSPVDADVTFPFGIKKRTLDIAVENQYLTKNVDFTLQISDGTGAEIGKTKQAKVTISPEEDTIGQIQSDENGSKEEVSALASVSDVKYGSLLNLNNAWRKVRGNGSAWCEATENSGRGMVCMKVDDSWVDAAIALSGSKWDRSRQWIYDGFRFSWHKSSGKSSWSGHDIAYYNAWCDTNAEVLYKVKDDPRFGWHEREYYFGSTNVSEVKFYMNNWRGKSNKMEIDWLKPILRPFEVSMKGPDDLKYYTGSGNAQAADANATATQLVDSIGGIAVKYAGDNIVLKATGTNLGKSKLIGAKIVDKNTSNGKQADKLIDSRFLNNFRQGDTSIKISLNNDFCNTYSDYINYSGNGDRRIKGRIEVKPVYGYYDSKITVNSNNETMADGKVVPGTVSINGTAVEYGKEYTYHTGDILTFTTKVGDSNYSATGIEETYYNKQRGGNDTRVELYKEGKAIIPLEGEKYTFMPTYSENNNQIVVRINKDDKSKFKKTGIFADDYFNANAKTENGYTDILVVANASIVSGREYILAAETEAGYQPVWKETNSAKFYMGTTFNYVAKSRRTANIVYLYPGTESSKYASIKGTLFYENKTLINQNVSGEPMLPAQGGYLSAAGVSAVADASGNIQTNAFHPVDKITVGGKQIQLGSGNYPIYVRAVAGASGATDIKDITLSLSGNTQKVSNGSQEVDTYVTDVSAMTIRTNSEGAPRFQQIYIKNKNFPTDDAYMNNESTQISVVVDDLENEKVTAVTFMVYDKITNEIKSTIKATKKGNVWTGTKTFLSDDSESADYSEGDRIYVQMTTDKKATLTQNGDAGMDLSQEAKDSLNYTVYAPVNTGYSLIKAGEYAEPTVQTVDFGSLKGLEGLPLVNNFNTNLSLGPVQLSTQNLYDDKQQVCGTRIQIGLGMNFDKTSVSSANSDVSDDGVNYGSMLNKVKNLKSSFKAASSNIKGAKNLNSKGLASMGAKKWGIYPIVGFYMDFAMAYEKDAAGTIVDEYLKVQGGGIFLGGAAEFSVAWYALIPVVYIPCYFGVAGKLQMLLQAGGTTKVSETTEEKASVDGFLTESHNLTETLNFDFQFSAAATIQVYCGVGICGTLGVRGGLQVDTQFIWYPTLAKQYDYFDPVGFTFTVGFKMWVDLLLFTIPIPVYTLPEQNFGLSKQYDELKEKNEDELRDILGMPKVEKNKAKEESDEVEYKLKDRENDPSEWNGNMPLVAPDEVSTLATYKEKNSKVLLQDGYDRPDSQMIDMGEYGTLLVFLQDDQSRDSLDRTALSYSVYKDGNYSTPVIIQTDGTADFQPNLCDAGDNVIISWISSDPANTKTTDEKEYLYAQEVYSVCVSKADLAANKEIEQSNIEQLTEDEYYDSQPTAVYDKTTGDYNVYYVKTAPDTEVNADDIEATDLANPMNTSGNSYSVMVYRVNENGNGWLVDSYKEDEKPSSMTDEEYKMQLQALGGQRFLSSPISEDDYVQDDPLISDFTGISYNGIGVFAYTIDKDNNADSDEDRDLFIQLYDFTNRTTYVPIRITDDDVSDSLPQLIRRGAGKEGTTYLFWKSEDVLSYIDVSSLVKYGVDDNGKILESALADDPEAGEDDVEGPDEDIYEGMTEEEIAKECYRFRIEEVTAFNAEDNQYSSYTQYKVAVDADNNLYVIWVDNGNDVTAGESPAQDIFATAMIDSPIQETEEGNTQTKSWAPANQLTYSGKYCDELALAIDQSGNMIIVYNKYDIVSSEEDEVSLTDMEFVSSILEPYGAIEAEEITLSDKTPEVGQSVDVTIKFANTGLTASKNGFVAEIYEKTKDGNKTLLDTFEYNDSIIPGNDMEYTFTYTANEKTVGSCIYVSATEKDLEGTYHTSSEKFVEKAEYAVEQNNCYQGADSKFYAEVQITNTGNIASAEGDKLNINFNGPYADAAAFGITNNTFATESLALAPGETKIITMLLDIPADAFSLYGRLDCKAVAVNADNEEYEGAVTDTLYMTQPADLVLNDNKDITLNQGDVVDLSLSYKGANNIQKITPSYVSEDSSVVQIINGQAVAVGDGTTTISGYAFPYSVGTSITVTVKGTAVDPETGNHTTTDTKLTLEKTKITKMVSEKKSNVTLTWKKVENAEGYQITYAQNKTYTKNVKTLSVKSAKKTISKLNNKKTYYFKVTAYAGEGEAKVFGEESASRYIKLTPRPGKAKKIEVTPKTKKVTVSAQKAAKSTGVVVTVTTDKKATKVVKEKLTKKKKVTVGGLKKNKKYYVLVRSYIKTKDGGYLYSTGKASKVKVK